MTAGLITRLVLHPFDTCKTRLQYLRGQSTTHAILSFIRGERIAGLYRGIIGALVGVLPYSAIYMPSYEYAQASLARVLGSGHLAGTRHVLAGSIAGLCGSIVKTPVDVVKKRVQAGVHSNVLAALTAIYTDAGRMSRFGIISSLYAGWRSAVLYDIPYNAIQFSVLDLVKRAHQCLLSGPPYFRREIQQKPGVYSGKKLDPVSNIVVGACTGAITSLLTEPLDVVKTRMMTQPKAASLASSSVSHYRNWGHCVRTIIREEGVPALWKGSIPRMLWVTGSGAIWYGTYATVKQALQRSKRSSTNHARSKSSAALSMSVPEPSKPSLPRPMLQGQ